MNSKFKLGMLLTATATLVVFELGGCKSNPYPDGQYTGQRPARQEVVKNYTIDAPTKVTFSEEMPGSFGISGTVPTPGKPVITVSGLPQGATFDPVKGEFSWKPKYGQGKDTANPAATYKSYDILVTLQSDQDAKTVYQQTIILNVNESARPFRIINFQTSQYMEEGRQYNDTFTIENLDSPTGPFKIALIDAPPGLTVIPDPARPAVFKTSFLPGYDLVDSTYTATHGYQKDFNWNLTVIDPRNKIASLPVVWHVRDKRLLPLYIGPSEMIVKSPDVNFIFMAQDPNFEIEPTVTPTQVRAGRLDVSPVGAKQKPTPGVQPSLAYNVHWSNIPPLMAGTTEILGFRLCTYSVRRTLINCADTKVKVKFDFPRPTPVPTPVPTAAPSPRPSAPPTPTPAPTTTERPQFDGGRP